MLATKPDVGQFELVVGMEVHAQALTQSKMFCRCATDYQGAPPNTRVCPVCLGMPGALPVINRAAVEATIKTGLALNCTIAETAVFARKNYTYPDLPKGYQISQYELPLCTNGYLEIDLEDGSTKQDPHPPRPPGRRHRPLGARGRLFLYRPQPCRRAADGDRHRGGHPQPRGGLCLPDQAARHAAGDRASTAATWRRARCAASPTSASARSNRRSAASTAPRSRSRTSTACARCATPSPMNWSARSACSRAAAAVEQVNMGWDEEKQRTVVQRSKEDAHDYRYFPEPDLPPLQVSREEVAQIAATLPELPGAKRDRYERAWGLRRVEANVLTSESLVAAYYEQAVAAYGDGRRQAAAHGDLADGRAVPAALCRRRGAGPAPDRRASRCSRPSWRRCSSWWTTR